MDDKYKKEFEKINKQFHKYKEKDEWNNYRDKEEWHNVQKQKITKPKPDPATVEAALRLEEELWAS